MSAWCFRWRPISDVDLRRLVPESLRRAFSKQYQRFKRTAGCHPSFIIKWELCYIECAKNCHVPSWHEVINIELFLYKKWLFYLIWLNKSTKGQTGHVHWRIDIKYIVMPAFSILNFKVFPPYFGDQFIPVGFESKNYIAKERNDV